MEDTDKCWITIYKNKILTITFSARVGLVVDFSTSLIFRLKDGNVIDKFSFDKKYSLADLERLVEKTAREAKDLEGFDHGNRPE